MDSSALNFEHLRPLSVAEIVQHSCKHLITFKLIKILIASYIKEGKDYQATRRIFCDVPFDAFEKTQLRNFRSLVAEQGIRLPQE